MFCWVLAKLKFNDHSSDETRMTEWSRMRGCVIAIRLIVYQLSIRRGEERFGSLQIRKVWVEKGGERLPDLTLSQQMLPVPKRYHPYGVSFNLLLGLKQFETSNPAMMADARLTIDYALLLESSGLLIPNPNIHFRQTPLLSNLSNFFSSLKEVNTDNFAR